MPPLDAELAEAAGFITGAKHKLPALYLQQHITPAPVIHEDTRDSSVSVLAKDGSAEAELEHAKSDKAAADLARPYLLWNAADRKALADARMSNTPTEETAQGHVHQGDWEFSPEVFAICMCTEAKGTLHKSWDRAISLSLSEHAAIIQQEAQEASEGSIEVAKDSVPNDQAAGKAPQAAIAVVHIEGTHAQLNSLTVFMAAIAVVHIEGPHMQLDSLIVIMPSVQWRQVQLPSSCVQGHRSSLVIVWG